MNDFFMRLVLSPFSFQWSASFRVLSVLVLSSLVLFFLVPLASLEALAKKFANAIDRSPDQSVTLSLNTLLPQYFFFGDVSASLPSYVFFFSSESASDSPDVLPPVTCRASPSNTW